MQITSISIFFLVSNDVNRNPNSNPHALYVFDPGIYIVQQLALSPRLAEKGFSMCLEKLLSNSDIKSLIYQKFSLVQIASWCALDIKTSYFIRSQQLLYVASFAMQLWQCLSQDSSKMIRIKNRSICLYGNSSTRSGMELAVALYLLLNITLAFSIQLQFCFDVKVHSGLACCIAQTTNDRFTEDLICHRLEDYKHAVDAFSCMSQANLRNKFPPVTEMVQLVCEGCHISTSEERLAYNVPVATPSIYT